MRLSTTTRTTRPTSRFTWRLWTGTASSSRRRRTWSTWVWVLRCTRLSARGQQSPKCRTETVISGNSGTESWRKCSEPRCFLTHSRKLFQLQGTNRRCCYKNRDRFILNGWRVWTPQPEPERRKTMSSFIPVGMLLSLSVQHLDFMNWAMFISFYRSSESEVCACLGNWIQHRIITTKQTNKYIYIFVFLWLKMNEKIF